MTAPDPVGEALIRHGLVRNAFDLDIEHALSVRRVGVQYGQPWSLPSRLFQFPIETHRPDRGQPRRLGLVHPALHEHPFVQQVEALGFEVAPGGAPNAYGYTLTEIATWWHACDLGCADRWDELLDTMRFSTPGRVCQAVAFRLGQRHKGRPFGPMHARDVLGRIGSEEPAALPLSAVFWKPSPIQEQGPRGPKGPEQWPVNCSPSHRRPKLPEGGTAWALVHALEAGWVAFRGSHLQWTPKGRERFDADQAEPAAAPEEPPALPPFMVPQRGRALAALQMDLFA